MSGSLRRVANSSITKGTQIRNKPESRQSLRGELFLYLIQKYSEEGCSWATPRFWVLWVSPKRCHMHWQLAHSNLQWPWCPLLGPLSHVLTLRRAVYMPCPGCRPALRYSQWRRALPDARWKRNQICTVHFVSENMSTSLCTFFSLISWVIKLLPVPQMVPF